MPNGLLAVDGRSFRAAFYAELDPLLKNTLDATAPEFKHLTPQRRLCKFKR